MGNDAFCDIYGYTIRNKVLAHFLECRNSDVAIGDTAKWLKISKPKLYEIVETFLKKGYVKPSRIIGKTQLYKLDKENKIVKIHLRNYKECIQMVVDEVVEKYPQRRTNHTASNINVGTVTARTR